MEMPAHNYTNSSPSAGINLPLSVSSMEFQILNYCWTLKAALQYFIYPQFPTEIFFCFFSVATVLKFRHLFSHYFLQTSLLIE